MGRIRGKYQHIMVTERDLRPTDSRLGMLQGRIRDPSLADIFHVSLQATPLVPLQKAIEADEEKDKKNEDQRANLGDVDEVFAKVINDRQVHLAAK